MLHPPTTLLSPHVSERDVTLHASRAAAPALPMAAGAVRRSFALVAALEITLLALAFPRPPSVKLLALALAWAFGQTLAIGMVVALLVALSTHLPARRVTAPIAAGLVAGALAPLALARDLAPLLPVTRATLWGATALPFALLALARPRLAASRVASALCGALGVAVAAQSPFTLSADYPGLHLAATVFAGAALAVALSGLAPTTVRPASRAWRVARELVLGAASLGAAVCLVGWPSNRALVVLGHYPTVSLVTLLAPLHAQVPSARAVADLPAAERVWFKSRADLPPVKPSRPALLAGEPIVILLTVDALRADVFASSPAAENLRRVAARGAVFSDAHSTATATTPAIAALFAGRPRTALSWTKVKVDGSRMRYFPTRDRSPRFPELLEKRGVDRMLVATLSGFDPKMGLVGRGFDHVVRKDVFAADVRAQVDGWLDGLGDRPGFFYAHLLDAHAPYTRAGTSGSSWDRYLGEIGLVDREIGAIWDGLARRGLGGRAYLIVSADHGEAFGEHGTTMHGQQVYEELAHVPLFVVGPGVAPRTVDEPASLIDVGPTVLDLFGVDTPARFTGQSLVPLLRGDDVRLTRPIVVDSEGDRQALYARGGLKLARDGKLGTVELYDLTRDPEERENLSDARPDDTARLAGLLDAFLEAQRDKPRR